MFTGIVEALGEIRSIEAEGSNKHFWLTSPFLDELRIDQSVAHNGVCLTVVELKEDQYRVTAIDETLNKTNLAAWREGEVVNLERCMPAHGRFDGHIVQGHVDMQAVVREIMDVDGSWNIHFDLGHRHQGLIVHKGSICINGVSLTVVQADVNGFSVSIIPYTYTHTQFHQLKAGDRVNIEFDILGKYVQAALAQRGVG